MTLRYDAPKDLREAVISLAYECGLSSQALRKVICDFLTERAKEKQWSAEYIGLEIDQIFNNVKWFEVYYIIELLAEFLKTRIVLGTVENNTFVKLAQSEHSNDFEIDSHLAKPVRSDVFFKEKLNKILLWKNIGWKLVDERIEPREPEAMENSLRLATELTGNAGSIRAQSESYEALVYFSRRSKTGVMDVVRLTGEALDGVMSLLNLFT